MTGRKLSRRALLSFALFYPALLPEIAFLAGVSEYSEKQRFFRGATAQAATDMATLDADEDGYQAWLRYKKITDETLLSKYRRRISSVVIAEDSDTARIIHDELAIGLSSLLGKEIPFINELKSGSLLVGTAASSPLLAKTLDSISAGREWAKVRLDGFLITTIVTDDEKEVTIIASKTAAGALYGVFAFLRLLATHKPIALLSVLENPKNPLRLLAHLDNLDGSIERGYAGTSLWRWGKLPEAVDPRLKDYARLNASLGINGVILNNVNAAAAILNAENLRKVAALADTFRPYGIKVYLCANFAAPKELGHLRTADPLDAQVIEWWQRKASEIYDSIPDFGGFLVKANSEDLPGPLDYGRTHADGANMLANALAPHGGIIMWRAFVYTVGNQQQDRVKRAYLDFKPLDGKFAQNALVEIKNGPLDYQPREPFHPLFGAMPKTRLTAELEVTQEYLGQSTHLVYLATMWTEFLQSNTYCCGSDSKVARIIETLPEPEKGGMTGIANTGSDRNWCGHHFAQANWFAFGRLAWKANLTASDIATEWIKMTWSNKPEVVQSISEIMLESREAYVNYTMPLGLHHMVGGNHYAPLPEGEGDPRGIYHHADSNGIGYDRTRRGSDAVDEYHPPLNDQFDDPSTCPEKYLLWFHHLPWDYKMHSGRTLWQELCFKYREGTTAARKMESEWAGLLGTVDARRHQEVAEKLHQQALDAANWSQKCLTFFAQYSRLPIE